MVPRSQILLRIPRDVHEKLRQEAGQQQRSLNWLISNELESAARRLAGRKTRAAAGGVK